MPKLNMQTFNEILLKYCKDDNARIELLEHQLEMAANIMWDEIAILLQELEDTEYNSEQFKKIKAIKNNTETIIEKLEELEAKQKEGVNDGKEKDQASRSGAEQAAEGSK